MNSRFRPCVHHTLSAKLFTVTVENFLIFPRKRHTNPVTVIRYRWKITHRKNRFFRLFRLTKKRNHILIIAGKLDPLKPIRITIHCIQRRMIPVKFIQIMQIRPHFRPHIPIRRSHLHTRMKHQIAIRSTQLSILLPWRSRKLLQKLF